MCIYKVQRQSHLSPEEKRKLTYEGLLKWDIDRLKGLEMACGIKVPKSDMCCEDGTNKAWLRRGAVQNTKKSLGVK